MDTVWIGYAAGFFTTVSFVPQVARAYRTKSCNDLSWKMLGMFLLGVALWLMYGVTIRSFPMIITNAVTLVLCIALVVMKSKYQGSGQR